MRKLTAAVVAILVACIPVAVLAIDGNKAQYVGGTVTMKEKSGGVFETTSEVALVFVGDKQSGRVEVPYKAITDIEYGQKAGRRVGVAVMVSPIALFSKKRNHFLTINFTDAKGNGHAAVFELGKDIIRTTLEIVKVRSGKPIHCQDEEAKKDYGGCVVMTK